MQACGHTRGPDSSETHQRVSGTQKPPLSLLQKQQEVTVRTHNPHKLTRTKKKAQTISGDRQGRHPAGAWRSKDSVGPPGRSRLGQEQRSQSWSSRPPSAPRAPSSRDGMQMLEGRQAGAPGKGRGRPPSGLTRPQPS